MRSRGTRADAPASVTRPLSRHSIASDTARFAIPAGKLGLGYRASGIKKLMDLIGPARMLDLFYSGEAEASKVQ